MSTISTLSLSHTHTAYVTIHIHTQDWSYTFKNPYTPSVLRTQAHTGPTASPPFPGTQAATATFTHTHTAQSSLPSITQSHQAIIMPPTDIYSVSVTHVICVTQTVATPPPNPNTHFFLCSGGSNRVASPKSPIFSSMFSVIKKFPEQGRRNVSDAFFSASPAPHPGGPGFSPSLRSRCKMPR